MDSVELKCIDLFKRIHLEAIGTCDDYDCYFSLLNEFFRRATMFAKVHNIDQQEPWQIIKPVLQQNLALSVDAASIIESFSKERGLGQGIYIYTTLANFTLFEKARELGIFGPKDKNIYAPLLRIYELKGEFHNHHGYIEFGDLSQVSIRNYGWMTTKDEPYIEFDEYF